MGVFAWAKRALDNAALSVGGFQITDLLPVRKFPAVTRDIMAQMRRYADDQGGALVTGGRVNSYTVQTGSGIAELRAGLSLLVQIDRDNTDAPTLNVDGTGPIPFLDANGDPMPPGRLAKGCFYRIVFDAVSEAWRLEFVPILGGGRDADDDLPLLPEDRPGEGLGYFTPSPLNLAPDLLPDFDPARVVPTPDGRALELTGAASVQTKRAFAVEIGRVYAVRFVVRRTRDAAPPVGDVRFGLRQFDANGAAIGSLILTTRSNLTVADSRITVQALVTRNDPPPAGGLKVDPRTRFAKPFVESVSGGQRTGVEVTRWTDATDATVYSPDLGDVVNRLDTEISRSEGQDLEHDNLLAGLRTDLTAEGDARTNADLTLGTRIDVEAARIRTALYGAVASLWRDVVDLAASLDGDLRSHVAEREQRIRSLVQRTAASLWRDVVDLVSDAETVLRAALTTREQQIRSALHQLGATLWRDTSDLVASVETAVLARIVAREQALVSTMHATARVLAEEAQDTSRMPMRTLYDSVGSTGLAVPDDPGLTHVVIFRGQSLELGATLGDLLSTTALYPTRALMPAGGVHSYGTVSRLVPLVETVFGGTVFETLASSTINHLIRYCDAVGVGRSRFVGIVCAKGSTNLWGLKQGSLTYQQALMALREIARNEGAQGRRVVVIEVWFGGENDQATVGYATELIRDRDAAEADYRATTGSTEPVLRFIVQTRAVPWGQRAWGPSVQCEQLAAVDRSAGRMTIIPAFEAVPNPNDKIHLTSLGSYQLGAPLARAILNHQFGRGHQPIRITGGRFVPVPAGAAAGTVASILLDVPMRDGALVKDTSGNTITVGPGATAVNGGIEVFDGPGGTTLPILATTITRAATEIPSLAPPQVRIDIGALPTVTRVRIVVGGRRDDGTVDNTGFPLLPDGPVTGARNLFRRDTIYQRFGADGSAPGNNATGTSPGDLGGPGAGLSFDWMLNHAIDVDVGPYVAAPTT